MLDNARDDQSSGYDEISRDESIHKQRNVLLKVSRFNLLIKLRNSRAILYNTLTKELEVLSAGDRRTYESLCKRGVFKLSSMMKNLNRLIGRGFMIYEPHDETQKTHELYRQYKVDNTDLALVIAPTLGCNFACDYCFQGVDKKSSRMDDATIEQIVGLVGKYHELKTLTVSWYGGEPLNDKPSIYKLSEQLMDLCKERGILFRSHAISNGYGFDKKTAIKLEECGMTWTQITMDGPSEMHDTRRVLLNGKGTSERIYNNIENIINNTNINVVIRCNVDERNAASGFALIDELAARFEDRSQISIYFAPVQNMTVDVDVVGHHVQGKYEYARNEVKLLYHANLLGLHTWSLPSLFDSICVGVRTNGWVISPSGELHKCFDTIQKSELRVADLGATGGIVDADEAMPLTMWHSWSPFKFPTCNQCAIQPSCAGACAYKFLHADQTAGDSSKMPCPSKKFNIAEQLFLYCVQENLLSDDDWSPRVSPTTSDLVGPCYSSERLNESLKEYQKQFESFDPAKAPERLKKLSKAAAVHMRNVLELQA